mmetsp:Transcript_2918/g.8530  ORF Transcript_2918/g.8530 Transcript_2918/m.8530 type:complete len:330 (-) Transcript_2918:1413-2402(-)
MKERHWRPQQAGKHAVVQVAGGTDAKEVCGEAAQKLHCRLSAADGGVDVQIPHRTMCPRLIGDAGPVGQPHGGAHPQRLSQQEAGRQRQEHPPAPHRRDVCLDSGPSNRACGATLLDHQPALFVAIRGSVMPPLRLLVCLLLTTQLSKVGCTCIGPLNPERIGRLPLSIDHVILLSFLSFFRLSLRHEGGKAPLSIHELLVGAALHHASLSHVQDAIRRPRVLQLVCHQDARLICPLADDGIGEHLLGDLGIQRRQRVVQEDVVGVGVGRAGDGDTLLLAPRHIHAALTQLCVIPRWHLKQISDEGGDLDGPVVALLVERQTKQDIVLH